MSRQLAERGEACLLRLFPHQRVRGGSQHEEKLLLTSGGRAAVQSVSDCQKHNVYCSIIIVGPSEEAKSQVQGSHEYELLNLPKRERANLKVL